MNNLTKSLLAMKNRVLAFVVLILSVTTLFAQIPERPVPAMFINDLAGIFTPEQSGSMEMRLCELDDSTSNQIVVVTVPDLGSYDVADFAHELGEKWGVGVAGRDNGVVIVVKPKNAESGGKVTIQVGYGLEGVIPDLIANTVINKVMIPNFINEDYYSAVSGALDELIPLASGEFSIADAQKRLGVEEPDPVAALLGMIFFFGPFILFIVMALRNKKKYGTYRGPVTSTGGFSSSGGYSSGRSYSSSRSYSSGRSFGGGHFGGGGASGSW